MTQRGQKQSGVSQDMRNQSGIAPKSLQIPVTSYRFQQKPTINDSSLEADNVKGISRNVGRHAQTEQIPD